MSIGDPKRAFNVLSSTLMTGTIKVIFIARKFPPSVGGMERFAFDLSDALANRVELHKITWGGSNRWLPFVLPYFTFRAILTLFANRGIDVIHIQDAVQAPIGWLLAVIFRKPYIIVAHGLDITYKNKLYQWLILPFVRRADAVVSISSATKSEVDARGTNPEKSHVITLGTYDDYSNPAPNRPALSKQINLDLENRKLLLTTGRLVKRKGVAWFIDDVLPRLIEKDPQILYLIAGEGVERSNVEKVVEKNNLNSNVQLLGRVSDEVKSMLYQSCDIFVMPNIVVPGDMEGFGIVVHEAATAQLPVVASNLEGIADALSDGKNGILLESKDDMAFLQCITELLNDNKKRQEFGKKAREYTLSTFSWDKIADKYVDLYKTLED